jgi:hypothetical protein
LPPGLERGAPTGTSQLSLTLSVVGQTIRVRCERPSLHELLGAAFGAMRVERTPEVIDIDYVVGELDDTSVSYIVRGEEPRLSARNSGEFLYLFDKDLTIELQRRRPDLYFIHAAVVSRGETALVFAAPSGSGKSTLTWALLTHGFRYLSDELAPIDLGSMCVHAYPHALHLKRPPPSPYALPAEAVETPWGWHVPSAGLRREPARDPLRIGAICFVDRSGALPSRPNPITRASAATRLFANALNPLAHANDGLDAAVAIAQAIPCFELDTSSLAQACAGLEQLAQAARVV